MHEKRRQHDSGRRASRDTQREQWNHSSARCRVVGNLRGDNPFNGPLPELLRLFRKLNRLTVAHDGRRCSADAGKDADYQSKEGRSKATPLKGLQFFQCGEGDADAFLLIWCAVVYL